MSLTVAELEQLDVAQIQRDGSHARDEGSDMEDALAGQRLVLQVQVEHQFHVTQIEAAVGPKSGC
jgi:hypothetical protein